MLWSSRSHPIRLHLVLWDPKVRRADRPPSAPPPSRVRLAHPLKGESPSFMSYGTVGPVCRLCWWVGCKTCQGCMWEILVPWHKCSTTFMTISHLYLMCETWSGNLALPSVRMPEHSHLPVTPSVPYLGSLSSSMGSHAPKLFWSMERVRLTQFKLHLYPASTLFRVGFRVFSGFKDPNDVSLTSSL